MKIALVGCGKSKLTRAAPAAELYTGSLFRASRAYAEAAFDRWFILSAKHGLLTPDEGVEPYDLSITQLNSDERSALAERVLARLGEFGLNEADFTILAGQEYVSAFDGRLAANDPLKKRGLGERLAWLTREAQRAKAGTPAEQLAADLLDWEAQFGAPDPKTDAECTVAPEDLARWIELARGIARRAA